MLALFTAIVGVEFTVTVCMAVFVAYPCSSGIGGRGYNWFWLSEKLSEEGKMKEITFRLEFDVIRRVKYHSLLFMATPD
jgi:hypothetical protein